MRKKVKKKKKLESGVMVLMALMMANTRGYSWGPVVVFIAGVADALHGGVRVYFWLLADGTRLFFIRAHVYTFFLIHICVNFTLSITPVELNLYIFL